VHLRKKQQEQIKFVSKLNMFQYMILNYGGSIQLTNFADKCPHFSEAHKSYFKVQTPPLPSIPLQTPISHKRHS